MIKQKNKKYVKAVLIFISVLMLTFICFTACNKNDESVETSDTTTTESANTLEQQIAALLKDNLSDYQVVRSETMQGDELNTILTFLSVLQKQSNQNVNIVTDFVKLDPISDKEIIIGKTSRAGSDYVPLNLVAGSGEYDVQIVNQKLVLQYADIEGMKAGLQYLLTAILDTDDAVLNDLFYGELFDRGIFGHAEGYSINNAFVNKMRLTSLSNTRCLGTATAGSTVSINLSKGSTTLSTTECVADENGRWSLDLTPQKDADTMFIKVDGTIVSRYKDIEFTDDICKTSATSSKIYVDGVEVDAFESPAGLQAAVSLRDSNKSSVKVKIVRPTAVQSCDIRPLSSGIEPEISGKTVEFTVSTFPIKLSVEFEDSYDDTKAIQLYLYEYEEFDPTTVENKLIYFPKGEYWLDDLYKLTSNSTVYIEEGAIVHARFEAQNAQNITIMGRGLIDTYYFRAETKMLNFVNCKNITLKDYTLTGPRLWMTAFNECENILIDAVNIAGTEINSDGIDLVGVKDVVIQNSFIRANDDCIAVKSHKSDVSNITVKNCVLWNMQYGNGIEIGYETRCDSISNILFEDIDIIHVYSGSAFSIHLGDRASVSNITYRNIRIEDARDKLIEFFIKDTEYTMDSAKGHINGITFENINIVDGSIGRMIFLGYDSEHIIENVDIGIVKFMGKDLTINQFNVQKNAHISNIKYGGTDITAG